MLISPFCYLLSGPGDHVGFAEKPKEDAPSTPSATDPFQPTVDRKEAAFLKEVLTRAETDPATAIAYFLAERPKDGESAALDFTLGNLYFQEEEYQKAAFAYRQAVKTFPKFRAALMNLGRVFLLLDKPGETIKAYQQLVTDGQADADIYLLLGHAMLMEDSPASAETAYRQALLLRPRGNEIRMGLAKALLQQQRFREGLSLLNEILQKEPLNEELWTLKANALLADEKHSEAIQVIEQAYRLNRASPEMLATLGDLWLFAEQPEDALRAYQAAFAGKTPSISRMLRALEGFLMVEDHAGASQLISMAEKALADNSDPEATTRLLRKRAELALQKGEMDQAATLLAETLKRDPLDGQALLNLSELQLHLEKPEQALLTAERAARLQGFEAKGYLLQARIEVSRAKYAEAIPLLETAQTYEPQESVARYLEQVRRLAE